MIRYISNRCKEQIVSEDQRFLEKSTVPTMTFICFTSFVSFVLWILVLFFFLREFNNGR